MEARRVVAAWIFVSAFGAGFALGGDVVRYPDDTKALSEALRERIVVCAKEKSEAEMKPYAATIVNTDVTFDMVPIPGGQFMMGSIVSAAGHKADEEPMHEVKIAPFWMGKCEVTWNEYLLFMDHEGEIALRETRKLSEVEQSVNAKADAVAHPTKTYRDMSFGMQFEDHPAIAMTQHSANKYCQWLSAKTGHFYRLPTEAEWEFAARAGTSTAYFWGDDPKLIGEYCWWGRNADDRYHRVGQKKPNPWGLYDMLGNVVEWTLDQYSPAYYASSPETNPWNKATAPYPHTVRGGAWDDDDPAALRCGARRGSSPEWKTTDPEFPRSIWYHASGNFVGFRVVRPLKMPSAEEMHGYWNSGVQRDNPKVWKVGE